MKSLIGQLCTVHGSVVGHPDTDIRLRHAEDVSGTLEDVIVSDDGKVIVAQVGGQYIRVAYGFTIEVQ